MKKLNIFIVFYFVLILLCCLSVFFVGWQVFSTIRLPSIPVYPISYVNLKVENEGFKVVDVVDGDTIKVSLNGTVETIRLIGIDTPETVHPTKGVECFGKEASKKMNELVLNKYVKLQTDPTQDDEDRYGRLLRYVFLEDGTHINLKMIEEGYALEYTYKVPYEYQSEFKSAERIASKGNIGFWGLCRE